MIRVMPFKGVRYNKEVVKDLNLVVTPPYDKIDSRLQNEYYDRNPYNFVRLDKGREEDKYESAHRHLEQWLKDQVLIRDEKPSIYLYTQEYQFDGVTKIRKGFISLLELDEFENGNVLPHEQTLSGPKKDRFDLLTATEATFGQIFMLFSDPDDIIMTLLSKVEKNEPIIRVHDDDHNTHCIWKIDDAVSIKKVQDEMKGKKVYIADGHHRYETSVNYRNIRRDDMGEYTGEELFNFTMCTFINMDDPGGMSILPTHRFIKNLEDFSIEDFLNKLKEEFDVQAFDSISDLSRGLTNTEGQHAFGLITPKGKDFYLLTLKDLKSMDACFPKSYSKDLKSLDVLILHKAILENLLAIDEEKLRQQSHVSYFRSKEDGYQQLKEGMFQLGFLLNGTKIEEVKKVTESGEKMPQKSTDFYPKLLSGLVINYLK